MHWHVSASEPPSPLAHRIPLQSRGVGSSWLGGNGWKVRLKTHKTKGFRTYKTPSSWHRYWAAIGGIQREMGWVFQAWRKGKESKTKQSWERGLLLLTCLESARASSKGPYQDFRLLVPAPSCFWEMQRRRAQVSSPCLRPGSPAFTLAFVFACEQPVQECFSLFSWVLMSRVPPAPPGPRQRLEGGHLRARSCQRTSCSVSWFTFRDPLTALQFLNCLTHQECFFILNLNTLVLARHHLKCRWGPRAGPHPGLRRCAAP